MTSRERVVCSLSHVEPDRVPLDIGSSAVTGIHVDAYMKLRAFLGMEEREARVLDLYQQTARVHEDVLAKLQVDTRALLPNPPDGWKMEMFREGGYDCFVNEWGTTWRKPKIGGRYFDPVRYPLNMDLEVDGVDAYRPPDPADPGRLRGLRGDADGLDAVVHPAFVVEGIGGELFDTLFWLRGPERAFLDFAADPSTACRIMDKLLDFQMRYWETVLQTLGEHALIVRLGDDLGDQRGTRISPAMYRKYVKPRHAKLISHIKRTAGRRVYIFLHSCGSVFDIVPDFIEIGVDILNPVQVSAAKMDTAALKRAFGADIVFWGGGVDTQRVLPYGTPAEVRDEVKRRIDDLAPGGGFVFNPVHNIQFDVPPENVMAMWETWESCSRR